MDTFEEKISQWLEVNYLFGKFSKIHLLRSYTNDVYVVESPDNKFVLKVYGRDWRTESEILWEIDFINHLASKGVSLAKVIPGKGNEKLKTFENDRNKNFAVLFEFAKGDKPQTPPTLDLSYRVGKAAGALHKAGDDFVSNYQRSGFDLKFMIDDSLALLNELEINKEDIELITDFAGKLKSKINSLVEAGLDWGPVHGDLTLDNLHVTDKGEITFYDFDSSGTGYRAMELYGWVALHPERKPNMQEYLRGYQEVRPLNKMDIEAAPFLQAAQDMWLKRGMKALSSKDILEAQLKRVKDWAKYFTDKHLL